MMTEGCFERGAKPIGKEMYIKALAVIPIDKSVVGTAIGRLLDEQSSCLLFVYDKDKTDHPTAFGIFTVYSI